MLHARITAILLLLAAPTALAAVPTIAEKTAEMRKLDGFLPLYWDEANGTLYLEIGQFDHEWLYQVGLSSGVGSNPVGLDRGQLGDTRIVRFQRIGPKVLLIEPNYRYRAITERPAERKAVEDSFASSVIWGFKVEAADGDRVLVNANDFFLRDVHGVVDALKRSRQGTYRVDPSRSAVFLPRTKGFPKNTEVETILTFTTDGDPGPLVSSTTPKPDSVTVRQHHSLVELPELNSGYTPRRVDPRVGVFSIEFYDYATPITQPIETRWISRHRLLKKNPDALVSEPVSPIIYYVDPGTPEPIRSALIEGASWWAQAFEAAGFRNAFHVEVLPEDADPMDLRYNMIHWVHRSTRGWSYGHSIVDPRTGEILKGNVTLGSLRVRQDILIGTGLTASIDVERDASSSACLFAASPDPSYLAAADPAVDVEAMALARIRQLSAHEVGHTLGFAHNFAASTYGRASVMDYPAPLVQIKNGQLDLSDAYARGIGRYDKFAVKYAYTQFPEGADESASLDHIVREAVAEGLLFLSDAEARPAGAADPRASLWDNGDDAVASLRHEMEVRRIGLEHFGPERLEPGTPLAMLEAKFLPLYLHHRYQLQAAVKTIGGVEYSYAVQTTEGASPSRVLAIVSPERQRQALRAVIDTISTDVLLIPDRILESLPPVPFGFEGGTAERFESHNGRLFDPIDAATIAADLAVSALLQRERAARLIDFHARDASRPDFREVVHALIDATNVGKPLPTGHRAAIAQAVQALVVRRLIDLAADESATPAVRAEATDGLRFTERRLAAFDVDAHARALRDEIDRFLKRPDPVHRSSPTPATPPGDPIGGHGFGSTP